MDERATDRVVSDLETIATSRARSFRVHLTNLSADGCMVDAQGESLPRIGSAIEIHLSPVGGVSGKLVWNRGGYGGIRFEAPLHDAVVKLIGFRPPLDVDRAFMDQFGRPARRPDARLTLKRP